MEIYSVWLPNSQIILNNTESRISCYDNKGPLTIKTAWKCNISTIKATPTMKKQKDQYGLYNLRLNRTTTGNLGTTTNSPSALFSAVIKFIKTEKSLQKEDWMVVLPFRQTNTIVSLSHGLSCVSRPSPVLKCIDPFTRPARRLSSAFPWSAYLAQVDLRSAPVLYWIQVFPIPH